MSGQGNGDTKSMCPVEPRLRKPPRGISIDAHEVDTAGIAALGKSDDARAGITAFLEKRKANFKDRVSRNMPRFFPWWKDREFRYL